MLVVLPHGVCVDPEIVKYLSIRPDRPQGPQGKMIFNVVMKTDADDNLQVLGGFEDRAEAETLTRECAKRINTALGVETPEEGGAAESAEESSELDDLKWED